MICTLYTNPWKYSLLKLVNVKSSADCETKCNFYKWFVLDCSLFSSLRKLKLLSPDPHWICNSKEISRKTQKIVCSSLDLCKLKRASYLLCSSPLIPDPRWVWSKKKNHSNLGLWESFLLAWKNMFSVLFSHGHLSGVW